VTLNSTTSGASIRYTTDGTTPSETAGTLYTTTPVTVGSTATINAIAYASGMADSQVVSAAYTIASQYQLTTLVSPNTTEGSILPATGSFNAGSVVAVSATANTGYVFTGFTGALSGTTTPQNVTMNAAQTVTANFQPGPTSLGGSFTAKTGPSNARVWTATIGNNGPGWALGTQITSFTLTQTSGTACTPVITTTMPATVGDIAPASNGTANVTIDFTGCPTNANFTVVVPLSANNGAAHGVIRRTNQLQ
jgi:uncharacterized repeat protein (TIGR02543 family)